MGLAPTAPDHALLYDSDCGFCRWSLQLVLRWDRRHRLRPVAIQSDEGSRLLAELSEEELMDSWHLVSPDGSVASAGAAAASLARLLPGGRPLAALFNSFPRLTERSYRWVADHRGAFGKLLSR